MLQHKAAITLTGFARREDRHVRRPSVSRDEAAAGTTENSGMKPRGH